jgi:hypothetical protein
MSPNGSVIRTMVSPLNSAVLTRLAQATSH